MDISAKKEEFSRAYVKCIAAQVGLRHSTDSVDDDSIDLTLKGAGYSGLVRNPQIEIQLKCSSQNLIKDGVLKYPLSLKNYNDLRGEDITTPRYLMVLTVPEESSGWVQYIDNSLILSHTCYWASLRFLPATSNETSVTVDIPTEQMLTVDSLAKLMEMASVGEYI